MIGWRVAKLFSRIVKPEAFEKIVQVRKEQIKFEIPKNCPSLSYKFVRSSGAGGQHVNKTCSKCQLRFSIAQAEWLTQQQKSRLRSQQSVTKQDELIIRSQSFREQNRNKDQCLEKLQEIVNLVKIQKIQKLKSEVRVETQIMEEKRLQSKRKKSEFKKDRRDFDSW